MLIHVPLNLRTQNIGHVIRSLFFKHILFFEYPGSQPYGGFPMRNSTSNADPGLKMREHLFWGEAVGFDPGSLAPLGYDWRALTQSHPTTSVTSVIRSL